MESDEQSSVRILLADDHPLIRQALRDVLEREADFEVVGEAGNGREAVELTQALRPDVVIMDISMPIMTGVEATKEIKASQPLVLVLILTVHTDIETIFSILQAGASGYLVKSVFGPGVTHTIRALMEGDLVLAPSVSEELLKYTLRNVKSPTPPTGQEYESRLPPRGKEILALAAQGMSNKEIGANLNISEATVKSYFVDIFQALNVRSRTEAVFVSLKSGILSLEDLG